MVSTLCDSLQSYLPTSTFGHFGWMLRRFRCVQIFILTPPTGTLRIRIDATLPNPLVATSSTKNTRSSRKICSFIKSIQGTSTGYPLILLCRPLFPPNLQEFQVEGPDQARGPSIIPCTFVVVVVVVVVSHIQRIGCQPEKNYFTRWPIPLVVC